VGLKFEVNANSSKESREQVILIAIYICVCVCVIIDLQIQYSGVVLLHGFCGKENTSESFHSFSTGGSTQHISELHCVCIEASTFCASHGFPIYCKSIYSFVKKTII